MDTKKVIAKLIKIAEAQQKIINKLAQDMPSAQSLQPNQQVHKSVPVAIREKMGPLASQIASVGLSQQGLQGGAKFKAVYSVNAEPKNRQAVENAIADAVEALQKENLVGVPMGSFYVERG